MKQYLDETEYNDIVRDYLNDLSPGYPEGYDHDATPIECRSRDGFIAHSHNHGGWDKQWWTDYMTIWGSGYEVGGSYGTEMADKQYTEARETYIKYDAPADSMAKMTEIPDDKLNYHDLYEMGLGELAEEMDNYCSDWLRDCTVWFGYRAMYEGQVGAWHTLMIYACASNDEYRGMTSGPSVLEVEIKFRNADELAAKLAKHKTSLESAL